MAKFDFESAVAAAVAKDPRYHADGYAFVRDALDYTIKKTRAQPGIHDRHVSGQEVLEGFRLLALEQFGPMALTVLHEWGIRRCEDVGQIVFNLIEQGIFGRSPTDSKEDFRGLYDFDRAFSDPFLPRSRRRRQERSADVRATDAAV